MNYSLKNHKGKGKVGPGEVEIDIPSLCPDCVPPGQALADQTTGCCKPMTDED